MYNDMMEEDLLPFALTMFPNIGFPVGKVLHDTQPGQIKMCTEVHMTGLDPVMASANH